MSSLLNPPALTKQAADKIYSRGVSVKDPRFGAKGDGIANDTTAIQSALDEGGDIFFPPGTYKVGLLTPASNSTIHGMKGLSALRFQGTGASQNIRLKLDGVSNVTIRDMEMGEDNVTGRTGVYGVISGQDATDVHIENVEIDGSSATGMHFIRSKRIKVIGSTVHNTKADGIHFQRGCDDITADGNTVYDTGDDSIGFVSHAYNTEGYCRNITITGNILGRQTPGQPGSGVALIGIIGATVTGNIIEDAALSGIRVTEFFHASEGDAIGGNIVITGNEINNSGIYSGAPIVGARTDGISIYNQRNVRVADNLIDKTVSGGIVLGDAGINVNVENNTVIRAGTVSLAVTAAEKAGNYLRLWTEPLLSDGTSLAYVHQHQPAVVNNTVRSPGTAGIFVSGSAARYISEPKVTGNHVYHANRNASAGVTAISVVFADKALTRHNYVGDTYPGSTVTNYATSGTNSIVADNHPSVGFTYISTKKHTYQGSAPTAGTWELADAVWNHNPQAGTPLLWVCSTSGTMGTLNGGSTTGSITSGTTSLVVSSVTGLASGAYITIAGVTGKKKVIGVAGTTLTLDVAADTTVSGAAIAYSAATFRAGPTL